MLDQVQHDEWKGAGAQLAIQEPFVPSLSKDRPSFKGGQFTHDKKTCFDKLSANGVFSNGL